MEFPFPLGPLFGSFGRYFAFTAQQLKKRLNPQQLMQVAEVIDAMGRSSAAAQNLPVPITSAAKFFQSSDRLYLSLDLSPQSSATGLCLGFLRVGEKKLFIYEVNGQLHEIEPACILDFYIHEQFQRIGIGKQLFYHMMWKEGRNGQPAKPEKMAYDRPSNKFLGFLRKYFHLDTFTPQANKFVVFQQYFQDGQQTNNRGNNNRGRRSMGSEGVSKAQIVDRNIDLEPVEGMNLPLLLGGRPAHEEAEDGNAEQMGHYAEPEQTFAEERVSPEEVYRSGGWSKRDDYPPESVQPSDRDYIRPAHTRGLTVELSHRDEQYEPPPLTRPKTRDLTEVLAQQPDSPYIDAELEDDDPNYGDYDELSAEDVNAAEASPQPQRQQMQTQSRPTSQQYQYQREYYAQPQSQSQSRGAAFEAPSYVPSAIERSTPSQSRTRGQLGTIHAYEVKPEPEPLCKPQRFTHATSSAAIGKHAGEPRNPITHAPYLAHSQSRSQIPPSSSSNSRPISQQSSNGAVPAFSMRSSPGHFQTSNQASFRAPISQQSSKPSTASSQAASAAPSAAVPRSPMYGRRAVPADSVHQPTSSAYGNIPHDAYRAEYAASNAVYRARLENSRVSAPFFVDDERTKAERFPQKSQPVPQGFSEMLNQQEKLRRMEEQIREKERMLQEKANATKSNDDGKWSQSAARKKIAAELRAAEEAKLSKPGSAVPVARPDSSTSAGQNSYRMQVGAGGPYSNRVSNEAHQPTMLNYGMKSNFQRSSAAYGAYARQNQRFY